MIFAGAFKPTTKTELVCAFDSTLTKNAAKKATMTKSENLFFDITLSPFFLNAAILPAGVDELNAVALISECAREIKPHPAAVFTLLFILRRSDLRVAGVADAVKVKVGLIRINDERAIVRRI